MDKFNEKATCVKCGAGDVTVTWVPDSAQSDYRCRCHVKPVYTQRVDRYLGYQRIAEHLERRCSRCGYTWPEATLPSAEPGSLEAHPGLSPREAAVETLLEAVSQELGFLA